MDVPPFALERWLDRYDPASDVMLGESGIRSLDADRFDLDVGDLGYVIPTDGEPDVRRRIGDRYGRSPEEVVVTCGTQEANLLVHLALLDAGDHAVVVTPTYQSLHTLPETFASVTTVSAAPPNWSVDLDAVAGAIRRDTQLIVLANPDNPTGRYYGPALLEALHELAADAGAYLHVDEVYRLLAADPHPPAATLGEQAISTAGISKAYGLAGARVGWVVAEASIADRVRRWKDYTTIAPPKLGHHVARQALGPREAAILEANRDLARHNRGLVAEFVDRFDLDWYEPTGVNGFPTVPAPFESGRTFCESVYDAEGVLLAPGDLFGVPNRFRIGFGATTEELRAGLDRMTAHVDAA